MIRALGIAWIVFVLVPVGLIVAAMWADVLARLPTTTIAIAARAFN
jgi:hypothetical protein